MINLDNLMVWLNPTPVFWFSLIPLPIIIYLNLIVFHKLKLVHHLSRHHEVKKPKIYKRGIIFNTLSMIFVYLPAVVEWRIFVRDPRWILFYALGAIFSITGLVMIIKGLNVEIDYLSSKTSSKGPINFH